MNLEMKKILEVLKDGGHISAQRISGGFMIMDKAEVWRRDIVLAVELFIEMEKEGLITHYDSMRQGHPYFHGRVDFYRISDKGKNILVDSREEE